MSEDQRPVLSLAAGYHLRAKPLCDGRVKMKNFELRAVPFQEDGAGHEEFLAGKYDTGEFSLANYLALKSRDAPFMAIPVFPNRKFRHSYIFVPENSPLKEPAQLKGKKVGILGWLNTAGLWARGMLSDEYGVKPQDIHWVMPRKMKLDLTLPTGTRLDVVPGEDSLAARMLKGEFDAIIVPDFPEEKGWRRLFADSKTVEQDFFRRTRCFPDQPRDYFSFVLFGKISGGGARDVQRLSRSEKSRPARRRRRDLFELRLEPPGLGRAAGGSRRRSVEVRYQRQREGARRIDSLCRRAGVAGEENDHRRSVSSDRRTAIVRGELRQHGDYHP